ncbi:MAG: cache domain-containing protein [Planktomarina sp.]
MRRFFRLSYAQKIVLLATLPLMIAAGAIAFVVLNQSRDLAEREIAALETQLVAAKREELKNYISLARTAVVNTYGRAQPDDEAAKLLVKQTLSSLVYGQDGYFFVFDYDGNNLVSPRLTYLIDKNWQGLRDLNGVPITDEIIRVARQGGGYHRFQWTKPSTREIAPFETYVVALPDWRWAIGTGIFLDDVIDGVAAARADVEERIQRTVQTILGITAIALMGVFITGLIITIRERRLADVKLKALTQRVFDTQEEERGRVARELHDSISQLLVGVRYTLDVTKRRLLKGDARVAENLDKGIDTLSNTIQEVRRISRDLRPAILDDLGLGPALKTLIDDFSERTGIATKYQSVVFRNRLDEDSKTALYRVAQEALTNIERHAHASEVTVALRGSKRGAVMRITDNGRGVIRRKGPGLGLRNMQERIDFLGGTLSIRSAKPGTVIEAIVPLVHMLAASETLPPLEVPE